MLDASGISFAPTMNTRNALKRDKYKKKSPQNTPTTSITSNVVVFFFWCFGNYDDRNDDETS